MTDHTPKSGAVAAAVAAAKPAAVAGALGAAHALADGGAVAATVPRSLARPDHHAAGLQGKRMH